MHLLRFDFTSPGNLATHGIHSALPLFVPIGHNPKMDAPTSSHGGPARFRHWLARHFVAIIATAIALATLGWKNQYRFDARASLTDIPRILGDYGWPETCVKRLDYPGSVRYTSSYRVSNSSSLLLDASIAIASLVATWILFSRTQRRCERWWQLSLSSLFALVMLAAVVCTVLKSESLWGW